MNKLNRQNKKDFIFINIFYCFLTFCISFMICQFIDFTILQSLMIAIILYLVDINNQINNDFMKSVFDLYDYKIKELQDKIEKQ